MRYRPLVQFLGVVFAVMSAVMGVVFMAEQTRPVQRQRGAEDHQAGHGHPRR